APSQIQNSKSESSQLVSLRISNFSQSFGRNDLEIDRALLDSAGRFVDDFQPQGIYSGRQIGHGEAEVVPIIMSQGTAAVGPVAAIKAQRPFMGAGVVRYASGRFQASLVHDLSIADIAAITGEVADLRVNPNQIARLEGVVFRKRLIIAKSLDLLAQTQLANGQVTVDRDAREVAEILHDLDCFF